MALLDDDYAPRFTPKEWYKPQDNTKALNAIGEDCYQCLNPVENCTCPE